MWCGLPPASSRTCSVSFGIARKGVEELDGQLGIKAAHALGRHGQIAIGLPATRDINGGHHERLVHGDRRVGKARNARLVAQRLAKRLAQHNARVLDGVVRIDLHVAHRMHRQIEQAMAAKALSMWSKNGTPVEISHTPDPSRSSFDDNVGLARLAGYLGIAVPSTSPPSPARQTRPAPRRFPAGVPTVMRRQSASPGA